MHLSSHTPSQDAYPPGEPHSPARRQTPKRSEKIVPIDPVLDVLPDPDSRVTDVPPLTPILAPWMQQLFADSTSLQKLVTRHGSPINLHDVDSFESNCVDYHSLLESLDLRHQIYFARKANRCCSFVRRSAELGLGVDTASYRELAECLRLGCHPDKLVVTAAVKPRKLIHLAIKHQVTIIVDNADECHVIDKVARELGVQAKVGFRISGFEMVDPEPGGHTKLYSRFGFDIDEVRQFLDYAFGRDGHYDSFDYQGLHFHLDGYSVNQRGSALRAAIQLADDLRDGLGMSTAFIDIGGGFPVNYLADGGQWQNFDTELRRAVLGQRPPITFENDGLGYRNIDGVIHGELATYPFWNQLTRTDFLQTLLLSHEANTGENFAEALLRRNIELRLEPGRSLLDQCGTTVARVAFRKRDNRGRHLVGLEMNMTQMRSGSADFLVDPVVIRKDSKSKSHARVAGSPVDVFFCGAYCLERDVLLRRAIHLSELPAIGDLIAFPNTAGYMMHLFESEAHLLPPAANLVRCPDQDTNQDRPGGFLPDRILALPEFASKGIDDRQG